LLTNIAASSTPGGPLSFRIPPDIIADSIEELGDFPFTPEDDVKFDKQTLVIQGRKSNYVKDSVIPFFHRFFPNNRIVNLDTGHWGMSFAS